jgi:primase-polymerase (primpol)-like protein
VWFAPSAPFLIRRCTKDYLARESIDIGNTHGELSPSGKDIRLFALGKIGRTGEMRRSREEMYTAGKYL